MEGGHAEDSVITSYSIHYTKLYDRHLDDPQKSNPFWEQFMEKLTRVGRPQGNGGRCLDELFLIHTYINNLYEIFEEYDDAPALELLKQIESES